MADLLALALRSHLGITQTKVFSSGKKAVAHCLAECPDLLIVDLGLPDTNGRDVVRALRRRWPALRVIVMTGQLSPALPGEMLSLGVSGFVHKSSSLEEMETAVRRVLENGLFFSAGAKWSHAVSGASRAHAGPPPSTLTEREIEIARLVAGGLISKEVAARLELSPRTVEKARARILAKLKLRDLPSLVRWCVQHGLV